MISPSLLRYHMEGLSKFITILPGGGSCQFITILQWGGGSLGTPNLYYVIYGRPLIVIHSHHDCSHWICRWHGVVKLKIELNQKPEEIYSQCSRNWIAVPHLHNGTIQNIHNGTIRNIRFLSGRIGTYASIPPMSNKLFSTRYDIDTILGFFLDTIRYRYNIRASEKTFFLRNFQKFRRIF